MAILNYTTSINANKTAGELQSMLAKAGAQSVSIAYDAGEPSALQFTIIFCEQPINFRLPCNVDGVQRTLFRQKVSRSMRTTEHARKVAWRIIKDWVAAQLAIVESQQAQMTEVFLPYVVGPNDQTMFQRFTESTQKQLTAGAGE